MIATFYRLIHSHWSLPLRVERGDGRIFLKSLRDTSFNKYLSNEPNFSQILLTGPLCKKKMSKEDQYFLDVVRIVFCLIPTS